MLLRSTPRRPQLTDEPLGDCSQADTLSWAAVVDAALLAIDGTCKSQRGNGTQPGTAPPRRPRLGAEATSAGRAPSASTAVVAGQAAQLLAAAAAAGALACLVSRGRRIVRVGECRLPPPQPSPSAASRRRNLLPAASLSSGLLQTAPPTVPSSAAPPSPSPVASHSQQSSACRASIAAPSPQSSPSPCCKALWRPHLASSWQQGWRGPRRLLAQLSMRAPPLDPMRRPHPPSPRSRPRHALCCRAWLLQPRHQQYQQCPSLQHLSRQQGCAGRLSQTRLSLRRAPLL